MRLGVESVGRWGLAVLAITGLLGIGLAVHGWSTRSAGLPRGTLGAGKSAPARSSTTSPSGRPSTRPEGPTVSPGATPRRPLLRSQPYASVAYQVWPGSLSAAARAAMTGLKVSVSRHGSELLVTAGVIGQPAQPPRRYTGGERVYVIEASLGDDSGNADYNLGDDAVVVTDAGGGIIQ